MKKSLVFGMMIMAAMPLFAQGKKNANSTPKWITNPPQSTATVKKVVSTGTTLEEARHNAINQLFSMTILNKEEGSYQKRLLDEGREPLSQHQVLVTAAENSSFFPNLEQYQNEEMCYVLCGMDNAKLNAFNDSLFTALRSQTIERISTARKLRAEGNLYGSATEYSEAIRSITPVLHRNLSNDEGDLVEILHNEFVHCLDGIELKIQREDCPMVMGEEIPFDILVTATYNNLPVSAMPLTFKISDDGKVTEKGKTDGKGKAKTHVEKAPTQPTAKLTVYTDLPSLSANIPQNMFSMELTQHLALEPKQDNMRLLAFDPTPTYIVEIKPEDNVCLSDTIAAIMKRGGNIVAENPEYTDLIFAVDFDYQEDGVPTTGKYAMQYFICNMTFTLKDRRTQAELAKAEKKDLRLFLKAGSDPEQIRALAISELYKRMKAQVKVIQDTKFDKRKVMFAGSK